MKKLYLFPIVLVFVGCAVAYAQKANQPLPPIDVKHYKVNVTLLPEDHQVKADVEVTFLTREATHRAVFELNRALKVDRVLDEKNRPLDFIQEEGKSFLAVDLKSPSQAGEKRVLRFVYDGVFDKESVFKSATAEGYAYVGDGGSYLLYPARWFPMSGFLQDRATFELHVSVPLGITVVSTGQPGKVSTKGVTEVFTWTSDKEVLPNAFVAAPLFEKTITRGNLAMTFYLSEKHIKESERYAETIEKIVDYYTSKFGTSPFDNQLKIAEVDSTVRDQAGALGLVFITNKELEASNVPIQTLARRLAYQWWLHQVEPRSTADLWLSDGFAYYSATLYMEEKVGKEALQNEIVDLATLALKFEGKAPIEKGVELGYGSEAYESVVAGKGAWVLHMLRGLIGDDNFSKTLNTFSKQYAFKRASVSDFEKLVQSAYGKDLSWFFIEWIRSTGVPDLIAEYTAIKTPNGFKIRGNVKQDLDLFRMPVELEIETKGKKEYATIDMQGKSSFFDIETSDVPLRVKVDPNNKILRNSESLRLAVHISRGRKLFDKGDFVEAIREFNEAIKLNPRSSLAHFRLAETFFEQFSLQSAAASFRDALNGDLTPKWLEVWSHIYLGKIYDILNQRERARAEYNKAINTKDDTFGAQAEAKKYFDKPFVRERATTQSQ